MTRSSTTRPVHSTRPGRPLKLLALLGLLVGPALGQTSQPDTASTLRAELTALLDAGELELAVRRVQLALEDQGGDPAIRREYVALHVALARTWLAAGSYDAAEAALTAALSVEPGQPAATRLLEELRGARRRAAEQNGEIDRLLRLELFESALARTREIETLRPDLAPRLRGRARAASLGAADDHYLARNFHEAFALYESLLASDPAGAAPFRSRWGLSLALALAESDFEQQLDTDAAERMKSRALEVLRELHDPTLARFIVGLLAELAGRHLDAGRAYADALGTAWKLPPVDRRRAEVERLRREALGRARELYATTPTQRRDGFWSIALPDVWKRRRTPHFDIYARNDLVAERIAEAVEFHLAGLGAWLAVELPETWEPRCELRVHGSREALHEATGTGGITFAVSHTRLQGERVLSRKLDVFQRDPWLLSSTLPHEIVHLLTADRCRPAELPLAIDEGLSLQAEPPARQLMYRLLLTGAPPAPESLLAAQTLPADVERFYAQAGALTEWLLLRVAGESAGHSESQSPVSRLLGSFCEGDGGDWNRFGLADEQGRVSAWAAWYAARQTPQRMPIMILADPDRQTPGKE